jgi:hypothetical protein
MQVPHIFGRVVNAIGLRRETKPRVLFPVCASYPLSQPQALSRIRYVTRADAFGKPFPTFNHAGFQDAIKNLPVHTGSLPELKRNVTAIVDEYLYPPETVTLVLKGEDGKMRISGQDERYFLSEDELDMRNNKSFFYYVLARWRTTYVPQITFKNIRGFYHLPEDASRRMAAGEKVILEGVPDIKELGIDHSSLAKRIRKHSKSMVFMPLKSQKGDIGMLIFTFWPSFIFNDRDKEGLGLFGFQNIFWCHMLGEMTAFTLQKLAASGQKSV